MTPAYPLDPTGLSPGNKITDEVHVLTEINAATYRILIPTFAPFYLDNLVLKHIDSTGIVTTLIPDVDYTICLPYVGASRSIGKMIHGGITINTLLVNGLLKIDYQTLGGDWCADASIVRSRLADLIYNPRTTIWDMVTNKPNAFPPINHPQDFDTFYGQKELIDSVNKLSLTIATGVNPSLDIIKHLTNNNNPHSVSKAQIGLSLVENHSTATDNDVLHLNPVDKYVLLSQVIAILAAQASGTVIAPQLAPSLSPSTYYLMSKK